MTLTKTEARRERARPEETGGATPSPYRRGPRRLARLVASFLIVLPVFAVLDVPLFDRLEPRIFGIPFLDAYLLLWVILLTPCLYLAARLLGRGDEP